ncbi:MAG: ribosome biogenesis GTPase YlqF, partial [Erysipelotrichaceae bacterium]|nr:ribosome biogenesis GTPase YlqF [Erysipelotrichaceae bacterium]
MSEKRPDINWYPGHMAKARRQMEEELKLVDIVIELRDARMPLASANPLLEELARNKKRLIVLNKADKADEEENRKWVASFERALLADSVNDRLTARVVDEVKDILKDKLEKSKARGIRKKVLRAMVVGIPNVGKSTFINNIVKKKIAKAENRPGVTRNLQWIRINEDVELLDTPGVLWPKFDDQDKARILALLGTINDDILDKEDLCAFGLNYIKDEYPGFLNRRYGIDENEEDLLKAIALEKKWLINEGQPDILKAREMFLRDIRNDNIVRMT